MTTIPGNELRNRLLAHADKTKGRVTKIEKRVRSYVKIEKVHGGRNVVLNAGSQYFTTNPVPFETKSEAEWFMKQLVTCLTRIVIEATAERKRKVK